MEASDSTEPASSADAQEEVPDGVGDALRAAVERTLAATADSATETRQRAQSLLDDVVRRGQVARDEVARRGDQATTRLAEAISDLRTAEGEDIEELRERIAALESRLTAVEALNTPRYNPEVEGEVSPAEAHDQGDSGG